VTKKKISRSFPIKGAIIIYLIKFLALLPLAVSRQLARFVTWISYLTHSKSRKTSHVNLRLCYPDMSDNAIESLTKQSLLESGLLMAETSKIWLYPAQQILPMIKVVEGESKLAEYMADDEQGVLIISPHLGNWELLYTFLASKYHSSALYRPPKIAE